MCEFSNPISLGGDEIWIFWTCGSECYGVRVAISDSSNIYAFLPSPDFDTTALFPTYPETGELIAGLRWADTSDLEEAPLHFEKGILS